MYTDFGEFFMAKRKALGKTLRDFCRENDFEARKLSRIERGLLIPPQDKSKRLQYANALGIKEDTDDWFDYCYLANKSAGRALIDLVSDRELMAEVPIIFKAMNGDGVNIGSIRKLLDALYKEMR